MGKTACEADYIAIVMPEVEVSEPVARALDTLGKPVDVFPDASVALAAFARRPPVLVVSALRMPGIDGWRLCRLLRTPEYSALNPVPILMVAEAYSPEETASIAADLGVDAYLAWPVDQARIPEVAQKLLEGQTVRPRLRALVVEDDMSMSSLIQHALAAREYEVECVHSARAASERIRKSAYDIAIIDFHLPDRIGDALLVEFGKIQPECACIMITGDVAPALAAEWMRKGASAYLHKPFAMEYLIEVCARARRERALLCAEGLLRLRTRALQASETKFREIIDQAADMIMLHDDEGRFVEANRAACLQTGYTKEELLKMRVSDIDLDSDRRGDRNRIWMSHSELTRGMTLHVRHRRKDGSEYPAEITLSRVNIGGHSCVLGIGRDISERLREERERQQLSAEAERVRLALLDAVEDQKQTEKALDRERDLLRVLVDHLPDGVCLKDSKLFVRLANRAFVRALGFDSETETLGKTDADLFPPELAACHVNADRAVLESGRATLNREDTFPHPDGTPRDVLVSRIPLFDGEGQVVGLVSITRDITAYKELEQQFRQAQKMESIGRLAGGIAHDFNNMLQSIFGNAELALQAIDPESPAHEDLDEIRNAARRSAELTGKLLAFARRQSIAPEILDLNEAIGGTLPILGRMIGEHIDFKWDPGQSLWPIRMDPSQLDQILTNLVINARDAISGAGSLSISTENITVDKMFCESHIEATPGDYVRLSVSDTGSGMSREVMSQIFEPFFTTKEKGKGTGLGLSTVYGIVRQNGGFIYVYSEQGLGTTFKIFLPRTSELSVPVSPAETEAPEGGKETVLVVEDEAAILKLTQRILESLGYTVLSTASSREAIALAERHSGPIHLLLTDVVMPVLNGRELAEKVRAVRPGVPVLYMSGYTADVLHKEGALEKGAAFLTKPFSSHQLARGVRHALGKMSHAGKKE